MATERDRQRWRETHNERFTRDPNRMKPAPYKIQCFLSGNAWRETSIRVANAYEGRHYFLSRDGDKILDKTYAQRV